MRILAIDTSNQTLSIAVCENQKILGSYTATVKRNHSLTLMPAIDYLMSQLNLAPTAIDRFVVAEGPGSYTGLRLGVTTAKTLAYTLKKELVGHSHLSLTHTYPPRTTTQCMSRVCRATCMKHSKKKRKKKP
ncbi:tRNA (adenosine(37)-N6)-threonylcarbamoyltransferase complex dimerization subunit type 1 TsaB, partial [Enterococcus faecalis]|uniref:tRNA (adenosine(37)-N6)-threonylcarbamoyltransferase complex dimerization subunit type 1 TsaB n=1 Tax=Enterococcus faecalis TaxID=1351 RepID=UPI002554B594